MPFRGKKGLIQYCLYNFSSHHQEKAYKEALNWYNYSLSLFNSRETKGNSIAKLQVGYKKLRSFEIRFIINQTFLSLPCVLRPLARLPGCAIKTFSYNLRSIHPLRPRFHGRNCNDWNSTRRAEWVFCDWLWPQPFRAWNLCSVPPISPWFPVINR